MRSSWLYFAMRSERDIDPVLICVAARADRDIGNRRVLGLARAMRDDRGVARLLGHLDRRQRLGERADLVRLDQDRVRDAAGDALGQDARIGHEQVITDQLDPAAQRRRQQRPAVPVTLAHAVLDRDDRIAADQVGQVLRELRRAEAALLRGQLVTPIAVKLGARHVEPEADVAPDPVTGLLDRFEDGLQRGLVRGQIRRESPLVPDRGRHPAGIQDLLERMEDLRAVAQRLAERGRPDRDDHELLDVQAVVRMRTAVDDVHHRHRHDRLARAEQRAEQRHAGLARRRMRHGQRHRQDRVGAEPALVVGTVQRDHAQVERRLIGRLHADQRGAQLAVDVGDRAASRPCPGSAGHRRRAARPPRACRWRPRTVPRRVRSLPRRA